MDTTAAFQIMVSQPLVAGWIAGWVVGEPATGLALGILFQALWGLRFGLGGAGFPLAGVATVVAVGVSAGVTGDAAFGGSLPPVVPLAFILMLTVGVAHVGGRSVLALRRRRQGLVRRAEAAAAAGNPGGIVAVNLQGVLQGFGLACGLVILGLVAGTLVVPRLPAGPDGSYLYLGMVGLGLGRAAGERAPTPGLVTGLALVAALLYWGMR